MQVCLQIAQDKAGAAKNCRGTVPLTSAQNDKHKIQILVSEAAASVAKLGLKKQRKTFSIYEK
jgi:hypothetical protein